MFSYEPIEVMNWHAGGVKDTKFVVKVGTGKAFFDTDFEAEHFVQELNKAFSETPAQPAVGL